MLLIQQGLIEALKQGDQDYRAYALPGWETGDVIVGKVDRLPVGKVRRDSGSVTASVNEAKLMTEWADVHAPTAIHVVYPEPDRDAVERAAAALCKFEERPGNRGDTELACAMLRAAGERRELDPARVKVWKHAMIDGEAVYSATAKDDDGNPVEFYDLPGITVSRGDDKLVVSPDRAALKPIIDTILSTAGLREIQP